MSQYADCCAFTGTVLVSEYDNFIFKKGYGLANREWKIPNTPEVKFRLGSLTKQFNDLKQKLFTPNLENYGYAWSIRAIPADEPGAGRTMISHGGRINGFNTFAGSEP